MSLQLQSYHDFAEKASDISQKTNIISLSDDELVELALERSGQSSYKVSLTPFDGMATFIDSPEYAPYNNLWRLTDIVDECNEGNFSRFDRLTRQEKEFVKSQVNDLALARIDGWLVAPDLTARMEKLIAEEQKLREQGELKPIARPKIEDRSKALVLEKLGIDLNDPSLYRPAEYELEPLKKSQEIRHRAIVQEVGTVFRQIWGKIRQYQAELEERALTMVRKQPADLNKKTGKTPKPIVGLPLMIASDGVTTIAGESTAGKSYFAVACGASMVKQGKNIIYIDGEGNSAGMKRRYSAWQLLNGSTADSEGTFYYFNVYEDGIDLNLSDPDSISAVVNELGSCRADMLVIDPYSSFFSGEENNADDNKAAMIGLKRLSSLLGRYSTDGKPIPVINVANTGKDTTRGIRGSSSQKDKADGVIYIKKADDGDQKISVAEYGKSKFGVQGMSVRFEFQTVEVETEDGLETDIVPVRSNKFDWSDVIFEYIANNQPTTYNEILANAKNSEGKTVPNSTLDRKLKAMQEQSRIFQDENDEYNTVAPMPN